MFKFVFIHQCDRCFGILNTHTHQFVTSVVQVRVHTSVRSMLWHPEHTHQFVTSVVQVRVHNDVLMVCCTLCRHTAVQRNDLRERVDDAGARRWHSRASTRAHASAAFNTGVVRQDRAQVRLICIDLAFHREHQDKFRLDTLTRAGLKRHLRPVGPVPAAVRELATAFVRRCNALERSLQVRSALATGKCQVHKSRRTCGSPSISRRLMCTSTACAA